MSVSGLVNGDSRAFSEFSRG